MDLVNVLGEDPLLPPPIPLPCLESASICVLQALVTFDDVAVCFSEEEWKGLKDLEKDLYCQVMTDNYKNLTALGEPFYCSHENM